MLKSLVFLSVLAVFVLTKANDEMYPTRNVDVDEILKNDRLLNNYIKCLLDSGPCTPEGKELRDIIEDALQTGCKKCSEKQKEEVRKVIRFLTKNKKESWADLKNKYDPDSKYEKQYKDIIEKKEIKV